MSRVSGRNNNNTYPVRTKVVKAPDGQMSRQFSYADMNRNGEYDAGDYVILSHQTTDGKLDEADAHNTSALLHHVRNRREPDLNGDGTVSPLERYSAARNESKADHFDSNSDGRLTGTETTYRPRSIFGTRKAFRRERFALANDTNNDGRYSRAEINRRLSVTAINRDSVTIENYSGSINPFARRKLRVKE